MREPVPIIKRPADIHLGFEEVFFPPKYVTGITLSRDPMSYDPAMIPLWVESQPNLLSVVNYVKYTCKPNLIKLTYGGQYNICKNHALDNSS